MKYEVERSGAAGVAPVGVTPGRARPRARSHSAELAIAAALVLILSLAVAFRTLHLNAVGFNSDEVVYAGQGAAIAQVPVLSDLFPVFRAHPLLFQFVLALFFAFDSSDLTARLVSASVGVITVFLVYALGRQLYGARAGLFAALFMALMPYHVVVTRQVLLDGSLVLFATLTLLLLARFADTQRVAWLYATAAAMGLTFLAKETGIILFGAIYAFLALSPKIRVRLLDIVLSLGILGVIMATYPLTTSLARGAGGGSAGQYLVWQLFRRPNHSWNFYPTVVPPAIGILVIVSALAGLWLLRRHNGWREKLLVLWILVPALFFELWPTKGFQYLLPIAPAFALLAARTLSTSTRDRLKIGTLSLPTFLPGLVLALFTAGALGLASWQYVSPSPSATFLAGSGGVPGGREAGLWIDENVPKGAVFVTIGPSMANILEYYGHRQAFGASVSPNPLHRNPAYEPIVNLDFQIRSGEVQYLVWDSFSAQRSDFFANKVLSYARKYHGQVVHVETISVPTPGGPSVENPIITIYEVRP